MSPNELWTTVDRHLVIDTQLTFPDHFGRPLPILADGEPIRELISGASRFTRPSATL